METTACLPEQDIWCIVTDEDDVEPPLRAHYDACLVCQQRADAMRNYFDHMRDELAEVEGPWQPQPLKDRFQFLRRLGRGGFGEVWLARDVHLDRLVAIKTLRPDRMKPQALLDFQAEAKKLAKLTEKRTARRHVLHVYDFTITPEQCYLIMEFVEGGSLAARLKQFGPLHWSVATRYIADVAEALAELHAQGLVHRDIKPDNILWDQSADETLLADFGLAAAIASFQEISGTPGYMAPEQWDGVAGPPSDVFALAATLFTLVTGQPAFPIKPLEESRAASRRGLPEADARLRCVPTAIEASIRRALSPRPEDRPPLTEWTSLLRGGAVSAFTDTLSMVAGPSSSADPQAPQLTVDVSVARPGSDFETLALPTPAVYRDMALVDPEAMPVVVPTGSKVRMRFATSTGGYLTLLNLGTSGTVRILLPNASTPTVYLAPGSSREVTVKLDPPAGSDQAVAILTREPATLLPLEWLQRLAAGQNQIDAYQAYRDMKLLSDEATQHRGHDLCAVTVKVEHR